MADSSVDETIVGCSFRVVCECRGIYAAGAEISRAPVARAQRFDADDAGGIRRVDEGVLTDRDADVRGATASCFRVEENQIAGLDVRRPDLVADFVLLFDDPRNGDAGTARRRTAPARCSRTLPDRRPPDGKARRETPMQTGQWPGRQTWGRDRSGATGAVGAIGAIGAGA